jgi:hypothetical protein
MVCKALSLSHDFSDAYSFSESSPSSSRHSSSVPSSSRLPSLRPLSPSPDFPLAPTGNLGPGSLPPGTSAIIRGPTRIKQEQVDTHIKLEQVDSVLPVQSRRVALSTDVIEISSDSDDEPRMVAKPAPCRKSQKSSKRKTGHGNQIKVTRQQWVDRIVNLDSLPSSLDISENEVVGYLIDIDTADYNRWKRADNTMKGIGRLKHEVIFSLSHPIGIFS